jgi:hypothetical protein
MSRYKIHSVEELVKMIQASMDGVEMAKKWITGEDLARANGMTKGLEVAMSLVEDFQMEEDKLEEDTI